MKLKRTLIITAVVLLSVFLGYGIGVCKERASLRTMMQIYSNVLTYILMFYVEEKNPSFQCCLVLSL